MEIIDRSRDTREYALRRAVEVLRNGGVVVYPTDTVYGLGANALDESALRKIFAIKRRSASKALPILIRNVQWAEYCAHIGKSEKKIFNACWPGATTVIVKKKNIVPDALTGGSQTVGMRVADSRFTDLLLKDFGYPITATSANISGEEPFLSGTELIDLFNTVSVKPDLIIDWGVLPPSSPSTVLDLSGSRPKILRVGPTNPDTLLKLLDV